MLWEVTLRVKHKKTGNGFAMVYLAEGVDGDDAAKTVMTEYDLDGVEIRSVEAKKSGTKSVNIACRPT